MRKRIAPVLAALGLVALMCAGVAFAGTLDNGGGKGNGQPTTTATTPNDPGNPGSPGNDCSHGASGKDCKDDPNENGKDCADHGKAQGNEDHCDNGGTTTTTPEPQTHDVCKDGRVQTVDISVQDDGSCNTGTNPGGGGCVSNCGGGGNDGGGTTTTPTTPAVTPPAQTPPVVAPPVATPPTVTPEELAQEGKTQAEKSRTCAARGTCRVDTAVQVSGQLPHTGVNAGLLAAFAILLLGTGLTLRYVANGAGVEQIGGAPIE